MDTFNTIISRRSIRKYKKQKVEKEKIDLILKAAMYAPSAFNLQPWEFIVVDDEKIFPHLYKAVPHAEMILQASHAVIICCNTDIEKNIQLGIQNISAAAQNMLLEIHELGLGGCWIGVYPFDEIVDAVKNYFNLPVNIIPAVIISI